LGGFAAIVFMAFALRRFEPRATILAGLGLLAVSSVALGAAGSVTIIETCRLAQGFAGTMIWAGTLEWLITSSGSERRGTLVGTVFGVASLGAIAGAAAGTLAATVGPFVVYATVATISVALALFVWRLPAAPHGPNTTMERAGEPLCTQAVSLPVECTSLEPASLRCARP
jgi:MFS family permease